MVFEKSLTAMVKGIRANRGKENEYINSCIQEIQKEVASKNLSTKSMAVLKLAYLSMMGYDMSWATFSVVEVMSHNRFGIKRPGYLAAAMSFTDTTDVGLLTINLFKKDFGSKSQFESGMAISCLSSICTPQISRDILTDLLAMLSSSRAYLRKKTVLCLFRVFVKDPPALKTCFPKLKERLGDEDQGVLTASVNTFLELARKNSRNYLSLVPQLYHILVNTHNNWLSIKLLKIFQLLCPLEARLPAKLVEPLTNLLNTTKAQSVEFEAIRCTLRTMPEGTAITALAVEKLQTFLNSSDRNLRYLALEMFKEALEKPQFKERFTVPDLHGKVLQCIEESDPTARRIALQLLDTIVSPATFTDAVRKLMDFSKKALINDEFVGTILRMGARDRYALVEDFAWYLLVLADISRSVDSLYAGEVAEQFIDISVRVAGVRPYAVTLAMSLLDRDTAVTANPNAEEDEALGKTGSMDVVPAMLGACAWVIGEYHEAFESPADASLIKAAKALLAPKHVQSLEPAIQTQCIWAALKLYLGAPRFAPAASSELHAQLTAHLPAFAASTHVDVSERAALAMQLTNFFREGGSADSPVDGTALFKEPLLPVAPGAQKAVPIPDGLDLDEPFFTEEQAPQAVFAPVRADPTDPYALAATYKDDLGFLAAQDAKLAPSPAQASGTEHSSMYYLGSKDQRNNSDGAAGDEAAQAGQPAAPVAPAAPLDPLEQMRERLAAARAAGGASTKYEVLREEVRAPAGAPTPATASGSAASNVAAGSAALPIPPEKELSELQGRLWAVCYSDEHVRVYFCVRAKNVKKQQLRVELRCERVDSGGDASVSNVALKLPVGVVAQEADGSGLVTLAAGPLTERSAKVRATLGLAPFLAPTTCLLAAEVQYSLIVADATEERRTGALELRLPATTFLVPAAMSEDDVATYMSSAALEKTAQAISLPAPGRSAAELAQELPGIVGRCAGLCHFYAIQSGQKFVMIARPPAAGQTSQLEGQAALPEGALIVSMCHGLPKDGSLDIRVTVKACHQGVTADVTAQLASVFRELVEGRLRTTG